MAAADPTTQQVIVPAEHDGYENVLDFSKAVFDKTKKTVTAPHITIPNISLEGVAIEYNKHLAFSKRCRKSLCPTRVPARQKRSRKRR
jgi:hypothetical protein